jgi:hypothetical protein
VRGRRAAGLVLGRRVERRRDVVVVGWDVQRDVERDVQREHLGQRDVERREHVELGGHEQREPWVVEQ